MRNPERINRITTKLSALWEYNPDLRLGQLIVNILHDCSTSQFYIEDDVFEKLIDAETKERQESQGRQDSNQ